MKISRFVSMPFRRRVEGHAFASIADIHTILLQARRAMPITGKEIAAQMGVAAPIVSRLESWQIYKPRQPTFDMLQRYAAALGLELRMVAATVQGECLWKH